MSKHQELKGVGLMLIGIAFLSANDALSKFLAERYPGASELSARIASYELAYRMQGCAPEAVDISRESEKTKEMYGLDDPDLAATLLELAHVEAELGTPGRPRDAAREALAIWSKAEFANPDDLKAARQIAEARPVH